MTNASRIAQQERPVGPTALMSSAAGLLAAGTILAPLAFGATEVWAYCCLQMLVAAAIVLWSLSRDKTARRLWLPLAIVFVGVAQVVPLSDASIERAAPLSFEARQKVVTLVDMPPNATISVNPAHTLAALRRCLMVALIVVVVADVARVDRYRRWFIRCVAAVGAIVLFLGLLVGDGPERKALGFHNRDGYWKFYKNPLLTGFHNEGMGYADEVTVGRIHYISNSPVVGAAVGALINANHFAVCVGLTLPIVLGLLLTSTAGAPPKQRWWAVSAAFGYALVAAYVVAAPAYAHARAGIAGIVVSGAFVAVLAIARTRQQRRIVVIGLLVVTAGAAVLAFRFGRAQWFGGRYETWTAALEMFRASPWLGVGLGNFPTVYPALRSGGVAYFAHGAWLEVPAEAGIFGSAVLLAAVVWTGWSAMRGCEGNASAPQRILRLGLIGGLLFAAFHAAFDYSLQIPGNAYLCAVLIGLLIGDVGTEPVITRSSRWLSLVAILPAIGFAGFLVHGSTHEIEADRLVMPLRRAIAMQRVPGKTRELDPKPALLQVSILDAVRAFEIKPHEATLADYLGQAFLHLSRGERGAELQSADEWFSRSLRLCPINPWTEKTLIEIRAQVLAPDLPASVQTVPDEPRKSKRPRRPTNARPGRSEP